MQFAVTKSTITPPKPVFLAGFGTRDGQSEAVLDELYMRVVLLRGEEELLIVTLDVLGADFGFVRGIQDALRVKFGLSPHQVILNFSHTHASVHLTGEQAEARVVPPYSAGWHRRPDLSESRYIDYTVDIRLYDQIKQTLLRLVEHGYAHLQKGRMMRHTLELDTLISRRLPTEQGILMAPNPNQVIDRTLTVLTLTDMAAKLHAVLFHCGFHPTTLGAGNVQISADVPGYACAHLEQIYPGSMAMFMQGCAADVSWKRERDGLRSKPLDNDGVKAAGRVLAECIADLIERGSGQILPVICKAVQFVIPLQIIPWTRAERAAWAKNNGPYAQYVFDLQQELQVYNAEQQQWVLHAALVYLAPDMVWLALSDEIPSGYSMKLKQQFPALHWMVSGYSNGVYTYIPTAQIVQEGGYEAEHPLLAGFPGTFAIDTEDRIRHAVAEQLNSMAVV